MTTPGRMDILMKNDNGAVFFEVYIRMHVKSLTITALFIPIRWSPHQHGNVLRLAGFFLHDLTGPECQRVEQLHILDSPNGE